MCQTAGIYNPKPILTDVMFSNKFSETQLCIVSILSMRSYILPTVHF